MRKRKILIATRNKGKVREIKKILNGLPVQLLNLDDLKIDTEVAETGSTFEENAALKAIKYAEMAGILTIAEDSGLEVDAFGGAPGVRSARYCAGEDKDRNKLVLKKLKGIPLEERTARFRCVVAIYEPKNKILETCQGKMEGIITETPRGENGFGYDPIFYLPKFKKTNAELSMGEKNKISHRGKAFRRAKKILRDLIEQK